MDRMQSVRRALSLIAILGIPAGVRAQADTVAHIRERAGCYALKLGLWSGTLPTLTLTKELLIVGGSAANSYMLHRS